MFAGLNGLFCEVLPELFKQHRQAREGIAGEPGVIGNGAVHRPRGDEKKQAKGADLGEWQRAGFV